MATDISLAKVVPLQGASPPQISNFALALVSAVLLILSFPGFEFNLLAWVALAPLMLALTREPSFWRAFLLGEITGSVFLYGTCHFLAFSIINYGGLNPVLAYLIVALPCLAAGLFFGLSAAITARCFSRFGLWAVFLVPFFWIALEYGRQFLRLGWDGIGYSQAFHPDLIQLARFGGVHAVGFIIVLVSSGLVFVSLTDNRWAATIVAVLVFLILVGNYDYGRRMTQQPAGNSGKYRVVAIQPNVPMDGDWDEAFIRRILDEHISLSEKAIAEFGPSGPDDKPIVVIWPESPMNLRYEADVNEHQTVIDFIRRNHIYLIWNTITQPDPKHDYNSVLVMTPDGEKASQYDKIYLLPFGEFVPARNWIPLIGRIPMLAGDFTAGSDYKVGTVDNAKIGASICFEATFPQVARMMTLSGATTLVNISDDGWFGPTSAARQHLAHAILRSVENNREMLRVTNSGITTRIRPDGSIQDSSELFEVTSRKWRVDLDANRPMTVYTRYGDLLAITCVVVTVAAFVGSFFIKTPQEKWEKKIGAANSLDD